MHSLPDIFTTEIRDFFVRPTVPLEVKIRLVEKIFPAPEFELIQDFCRTLVRKGRLGLIPELDRLCAEERCRFCELRTAQVRTPYPLGEEHREKLTAVLGDIFEAEVEIDETIDPTLIGGLKVKVEDHVFDNSVAHTIDQFKESNLKPEAQ